ncbi:UvrD-helicase domain-containing protein [Natronosporangium hydrolyticum]|uniref:UvrD-helicase domain-containing protein n=1 Tax=Natronosporangium hydrolyticum TaxID=2811111 RepID=UPI001EFA0D02|nr:UvrD-helicase domain-containing protein [Natronosporangium hydrolyticum]
MAASAPQHPSSADPAVASFVADLHIHSKYSRACSRDLELPNLAYWARRKGVAVVGTGDITHPAWREHVRESLRPAEPGLFRLPAELERQVDQRLPARVAASAPTRFLLSVEISTIYKRDGRTRKVHHLVYLPDLPAADRFAEQLGRIGNLASDGRPILGLDSRDLLELTLTASPEAFLVPAHIWTPWFSALGSKSGFDAIADCYADLADHIFAVETGLSSDPAMNHRVSSLDSYHLISCSDAHSPPALAREATEFACELDYYAIREAMRTGDGLAGTIEFFPEEGKYHADGHRACGVNWSPAQTRAAGGVCPECAKPLTVGVLSRVEALADRPADAPPPAHAKPVTYLVALAEILGELNRVGPKSKKVAGKLNELVAALGPELTILTQVPVPELRRVGGELFGEAIDRLRRGEVRRSPGFDGEYGVIRLFDEREVAPGVGRGGPPPEALFELAAPPKPTPAVRFAPQVSRAIDAPSGVASEPVLAGMEEVGTGLLDRLDAMQRVAASAPGGPLLVVAGPGTGKTRTLTHRIAYLCAELGVSPDQCLAITFTRRAAGELGERLAGLLGEVAEGVTVATFHALGLTILREQPAAAGLSGGFRVADEPEQAALRAEAGEDDEAYRKLLRAQNLVEVDELVGTALAVLRGEPALAESYRRRWPWLFVDEYQDVDADQYALLRELSPADGNLYAIGDPDQSIYSFRGAEVEFFLRFAEDFTDARVVRLSRNYRSAPPIIAAAVQAIAPTTLVRERRLEPARLLPDAPLLGRYQAGSAADEAQFVARTVDALVGGVSHRSLDAGGRGGLSARSATGEVSFADIAVLYRTDAQAGPVLDALQRAGIPVQKRSHNRLASRTGVAEVARELRLAGPAAAGDVATRVKRAGQTLAERYDAPTLDPADTVTVTPREVWAAVEVLTPLAQECGDDLPQFLTALAAGSEVDALDPRAEAVTLLTVHAAKGLEFPVVFLIGVEDGVLPLTFGGAPLPESAVAEERRLFFVGLTRAQDRLFVSYRQRPSRFLGVIDTALFESLGPASPPRPRHQQPRLL